MRQAGEKLKTISKTATGESDKKLSGDSYRILVDNNSGKLEPINSLQNAGLSASTFAKLLLIVDNGLNAFITDLRDDTKVVGVAERVAKALSEVTDLQLTGGYYLKTETKGAESGVSRFSISLDRKTISSNDSQHNVLTSHEINEVGELLIKLAAAMDMLERELTKADRLMANGMRAAQVNLNPTSGKPAVDGANLRKGWSALNGTMSNILATSGQYCTYVLQMGSAAYKLGMVSAKARSGQSATNGNAQSHNLLPAK